MATNSVAEVTTDAACPLTFAMNFTEDLRATAVLADGQRRAVSVFPAYGALTGVIVPSHAQKILVRAEPPHLPLAPSVGSHGYSNLPRRNGSGFAPATHRASHATQPSES